MYVALATDKEMTGKFIDRVTYYLHTTFNPSKISIDEPPFILSRIGWGIFIVNIDIIFKKWTNIPKMRLNHMLSF